MTQPMPPAGTLTGGTEQLTIDLLAGLYRCSVTGQHGTVAYDHDAGLLDLIYPNGDIIGLGRSLTRAADDLADACDEAGMRDLLAGLYREHLAASPDLAPRPVLDDPGAVAAVRRLLAAARTAGARHATCSWADGASRPVRPVEHTWTTKARHVAFEDGRLTYTNAETGQVLDAHPVDAVQAEALLIAAGAVPAVTPAPVNDQPEYRIDFARIGRHDRPAGLTVPAPTDADALAERVQRYAAHLCGLDACDVDVELDLATGRVAIADEYGPLGHGWVTSPGVSHTATPAPVGPDAERRAGYVAQLRALTDAIEHHALPVPKHRLSISGALPTRADVDRWAAHLGVEVRMGGTGGGLPVAARETPIGDNTYPLITVSMQGPPELSELDRLRARVAELEAQQAEGGAR